MPSAYRRIAVVCDPEMERALAVARAARVRPISEAGLVRELALAGVRTMELEEERRRAAVEAFIEMTARERPEDYAALGELRQCAWGADP
jgi:hypothetical protein